MSIQRLAQLAEELFDAQQTAKKAEEALARAQAEVQRLEEQEIPALMDDLGMERFTTASGFSVSVEPSVHASISEANREAAIRWLEEHGEGGMVRRDLILGFNAEEEDQIARLRNEVEYPSKIVRNVHPSTLRAWVRRRLEEGEEVPNTISTHVVRKAVIK